MTGSGHPCDAMYCERPATQVGTAQLSIQPIEVRLCDEHVAAFRAGKLRGMSQDQRSQAGGAARPRLTFDR